MKESTAMARQIINETTTDSIWDVSRLIVLDDGVEIGRFATMAEFTAWRAIHEPEALAAEQRHVAEVRAKNAEAEAAYKARCAAERAAAAEKNSRNPFAPRN